MHIFHREDAIYHHLQIATHSLSVFAKSNPWPVNVRQPQKKENA